MSRLINRSSNANLTKANIQRLAQKDLAKLELARRQTNLINNERQHKTNKVPVCPEKPASSSDSGDESDRPAKRPRLSLAQDDSPTDVVFIREVLNSTTNTTTTSIVPHGDLPLVNENQRNGEHIPSSSSSAEFASLLRNEIKAEEESGGENSNQNWNNLTIGGFEIITDEAEVKLVRTLEAERIQVTCNLNNSLFYTSDDATSTVSLPSFTVEVIKQSSRLSFSITLDDTDTQDIFDIRLESFSYLEIDPSAPNPIVEGSKHYRSAFSNCPVKLHDISREYLSDRGINRQFCHELIKYATHREHFLYVQLLKKSLEFIQS